MKISLLPVAQISDEELRTAFAEYQQGTFVKEAHRKRPRALAFIVSIC